MMKRWISALSLLLSAALLAASLGGCGIVIIHHAGPDDTTESNETVPIVPGTSGDRPITPTGHEIRDYAPDAASYLGAVSSDFGGTSVIVASSDKARITGEDAAAAVSAAIRARNEAVERSLGVSLLLVGCETEEFADKIREAEDAGLYFADLMLVPSAAVAPLAAEGLLMNLRSLPFVHFDEPYFYASSADAFSVGITTWALAGMASLDTDLLPALYCNRRMLTEAGAQMPYEAVYDGVFTWDTFFADMTAIRAVNENAMIAAGSGETAERVFAAAGGTFVLRDKEGLPHLAITGAGIDTDRVTLLRRLLSLPRYTGEDEEKSFFTDGGIAFYFGTLQSGVGRGTSATQWGLLPMPAETVTDAAHPYRSLVPTSGAVFASPRLTSSVTLTGRLLSALNAASYGVLLTAEAETRADADFRDLDSAYMFVEIGFGATYDFSAGLGASDEMLPGLVHGLVRRAAAGEDLAALLEEQREAIEAILSSFVP